MSSQIYHLGVGAPALGPDGYEKAEALGFRHVRNSLGRAPHASGDLTGGIKDDLNREMS